MTNSFAKGRALIIAISRYQKVSDLPSAILNDAADIAATLKDAALCGYPPANVRVLQNDEATKQRIVQELQHLASSAGDEDTVIVYFSGHGGRIHNGAADATYLCPVDCDLNDLARTGLEASEVTTLLRAIRSSRLAVLLDACHAAGAGELKSALKPEVFKSGVNNNTLDQLGKGVGRVILASSREDEVSHALGGMRNSLFTHHLLEGLRGKAHVHNDGLIRVLDLFGYVARAVSDQHNQHPVLKADALQDNFPLALCRGGSKDVAFSPVQSPATEAEHKAFETLLASLYPSGPADMEIWSRAGGDVAMLKPGLPGRAAWHAALKALAQGGGGSRITLARLAEVALEDFPNNTDLAALARSLEASR
jgi:uncharacterized caspase-like protein